MKTLQKNLKTAVIGVGYLGRFHAHKYASSSQAELVALVDKDVKKAYDVAEELCNEGLSAKKVLVGSEMSRLNHEALNSEYVQRTFHMTLASGTS